MVFHALLRMQWALMEAKRWRTTVRTKAFGFPRKRGTLMAMGRSVHRVQPSSRLPKPRL